MQYLARSLLACVSLICGTIILYFQLDLGWGWLIACWLVLVFFSSL